MLRLSSRARPVITVQREVRHLYHVQLVTIVELRNVTLLYQVNQLIMLLLSTNVYMSEMVFTTQIELGTNLIK